MHAFVRLLLRDKRRSANQGAGLGDSLGAWWGEHNPNGAGVRVASFSGGYDRGSTIFYENYPVQHYQLRVSPKSANVRSGRAALVHLQLEKKQNDQWTHQS